ncbi:hypothetical protein J4467_01105 [Candidatus Woesearchaeota archaeon]|nr:hypothetical protein [Candidatus Woesearchaeota archaeon]
MSNLREALTNIQKLIEAYEKEQLRTKKIQILNFIQKEINEIESHINQNEGTVHIIEKTKLIKELKIIEHKNIPEHHKEYKISNYGRISNIFFGRLTEFIIETFPKLNTKVTLLIRGSGLRMLTNTYISTTLFSTFLALFIGAAIGTIFFYQTSYIYGLLLGPVLSLITVFTFIIYPLRRFNKRKKELDEEYPFIVNYLSALSKSEITELTLFEILLNSHQKTLVPEIKKIILCTKVFNEHISEAIIKGTEDIPSEKVKIFFKELSEIYKNNKDPTSYLNKKAHECIIEYESLNKSPFKVLKNLFQEIFNAIKQIEFNPKRIALIILGSLMIILTFIFTTSETALFPLLILISFIIIWGTIFQGVYKIWGINREQETEFLEFVKELNKTKNPLTLNKDFKILDLNIKKFTHQYKIGIPIEKAFETFSKETNNILIESSITLALEAKKHNANIYEALENITKSKVLKNILRIERI